jgi:hypothetical protein
MSTNSRALVLTAPCNVGSDLLAQFVRLDIGITFLIGVIYRLLTLLALWRMDQPSLLRKLPCCAKAKPRHVRVKTTL